MQLFEARISAKSVVISFIATFLLVCLSVDTLTAFILFAFGMLVYMEQLLLRLEINADLKICQYLCLHMKIICRRFHIGKPFKF